MHDILLIDGSNLARRNFHAQNLKTSGGTRTGLTYGLINSILSIQNATPYKSVVVVWDGVDSSAKRRAMYPQYKDGRSTESLSEYSEDKELCKQLLTALGVAQAEREQAECDDVIAYLVGNVYHDRQVDILSTDKDFYALISGRVAVMKPDQTFVIPDADGKIWFKDKNKLIGILPSQMVDYKSLVGDDSDNIPGAPGFGVGAALTFFANNERAAGKVNIDGLNSKAVSGLREVLPNLKLYKELVKLHPEWGVVPPPTRPTPNKSVVSALFEQLEFKQFANMGDAIYIVGGTDV